MKNLEQFGLTELDLNEKMIFDGGAEKGHDHGALVSVVAGVVGMTVIALSGAGALALAGAALWTAASAYSYK